jgi:hypothetical protein
MSFALDAARGNRPSPLGCAYATDRNAQTTTQNHQISNETRMPSAFAGRSVTGAAIPLEHPNGVPAATVPSSDIKLRRAFTPSCGRSEVIAATIRLCFAARPTPGHKLRGHPLDFWRISGGIGVWRPPGVRCSQGAPKKIPGGRRVQSVEATEGDDDDRTPRARRDASRAHIC